MCDLIFENINDTTINNNFINYAKKLNLNIVKFKKDLSDTDVIKKHSLNTKKLFKLGVYSTPSFVVNGKLIDEDNSIDFLDTIIKEELENYE